MFTLYSIEERTGKIIRFAIFDSNLTMVAVAKLFAPLSFLYIKGRGPHVITPARIKAKHLKLSTIIPATK